MRNKKLIIGNWKMNPVKAALAKANFLAIKKGIQTAKNVDVAIAAPFVYLSELSKIVSARLSLAAQNAAGEKEGPFTGEVSPDMLAACKVKYVILGHSERRALGETNELISCKIKATLKAKLTPVLCVGETDREHGMWHLSLVKTQIEECLAGLPKTVVKNLVIAYEPVWAISSTPGHKDAKPADFEEMRIYIRKVLTDMFGGSATDVTILYGGSVDETNAAGFLIEGGADGLLPGRASLTPKKFIKIIEIANAIR